MLIFLGRKRIGEQQEKNDWSLLGCSNLQRWGRGRDQHPKCYTDCVNVCRVAREAEMHSYQTCDMLLEYDSFLGL